MSVILLTSWDSPHPPECPSFDYEDHAGWQSILQTRVGEILVELANGALDSRSTALETRPTHLRLFSELTPDGHSYFAGHYRGERFRCLQHYSVTILSDRRVGVPPSAVEFWLEEFKSVIRAGLDALDADYTLSRAERLRYLIAFTCRAFELFLRIHPYANGNGHVARFMVWCLLGRYDHWPHRWAVEPRPPDPPYTDLIKRYRDGDKAPLEQFLVSMLIA